jgi:hypothetical protein
MGARARVNRMENGKRKMRDTLRIERDDLLGEQEGWIMYRDCPYYSTVKGPSW